MRSSKMSLDFVSESQTQDTRRGTTSAVYSPPPLARPKHEEHDGEEELGRGQRT